MTRRSPLLAILFSATLGFGQSRAEPPGLTTLAIGAQAPDFALPGVDGRTYSLKDFAKAKLLVVAFTCNHCPTAQAYEERLDRFFHDYQDKGVTVIAISPNDPRALRLDELGYSDVGDSFEDMKFRAKDHKFPYPYLYDGETQTTATAYGVLATPHVYVFDEGRKLRYVGRFDDAERGEVKSHDARNAVDALLAGKPVPVEKTRTFGCSTKWADKRADVAKALAKWDAEPVSLDPIDVDAVAKLVKNDTKNLLLINVWATWCGPCVNELPEFVTLNRTFRARNFKLVMISIDAPGEKDDALKVLSDRHLSSANYILATPDKDAFANALDKEWPGPLPYTLVIAPGGRVLYRKVNEADPLELRRVIVEALERKPVKPGQ